MIQGFEEQTKELNEVERKAAVQIAELLSRAVGKWKVIKNADIRRKIDGKLSSARIRKIIHTLRVTGLVPLLIADSNGYYIAETKAEVELYAESLRGRIESIKQILQAIVIQSEDFNFEKRKYEKVKPEPKIIQETLF